MRVWRLLRSWKRRTVEDWQRCLSDGSHSWSSECNPSDAALGVLEEDFSGFAAPDPYAEDLPSTRPLLPDDVLSDDGVGDCAGVCRVPLERPECALDAADSDNDEEWENSFGYFLCGSPNDTSSRVSTSVGDMRLRAGVVGNTEVRSLCGGAPKKVIASKLGPHGWVPHELENCMKCLGSP